MIDWQLSLLSCTKVALRPPPSQPHGPCELSLLHRQGLSHELTTSEPPIKGWLLVSNIISNSEAAPVTADS